MANPVRDCDGHTVWRVRVAPGELTCTGCGETLVNGACVICTFDGKGQATRPRPPAVPTVSYLREGEYTLDH